MSKHTIIITLAIWIIALQFLGFPGFWRTLILVLSSLGIIFYTFLMRNESPNGSSFNFNKNTDVYVENGIENNDIKNKKKK